MNTNILTQELLAMLVPKVALIAYENQTDHGDKYFLEMRTIGEGGTMGTGVPVTYEFLREISETYAGKNTTTPSGAIPTGLLYADTRKGSEKYVWWNPPRKRMMYFAETLGVPDGEYHVPGVIYEAGEGRLNIYAFTDEVPTAGTVLYSGPFFNTTGGSVCLGSSSLKRPSSPTWAQMMAFWEDKFWCTTFTHLGGGGNPTCNNLVLVTRAAADRPFDTAELKPSGKTLKDLLK
ncbi:MAG: prokaryotic E2 ligase family D protein [Alistipes sp.]|jgi:PRTRC genetic system protein B|nr:prokaryotic E2 ligase family D protein [Alistipes sp.]